MAPAPAPSAAEAATRSSLDLAPVRTEFAFELPVGFVDDEGRVHKHGIMRLATARDEILPLRDPRVRENEASLTILLLARVVTSLGELEQVHAGIVERLFAADLAFLQDLYRRVNQEGHTRAAVTCPACSHDFEVDVSGDASGGS